MEIAEGNFRVQQWAVAGRRLELVSESIRIPGGLRYYDSGNLGTVGHCVVKAEEAESTITGSSCRQESD
jgi:hypothetical protein